MTTKKSLAAVIIVAMLAATAVAAGGMLTEFQLRPPSQITLSDLWSYLWSNGLAGNCGPGLGGLLDLDCRFDHFRSVAAYPPTALRLAVVTVATIIGATVAGLLMIRKVPARETFHTVRGGRPLFDRDGRASLRSSIKKTGSSVDALWLMPYGRTPGTPARRADRD